MLTLLQELLPTSLYYHSITLNVHEEEMKNSMNGLSALAIRPNKNQMINLTEIYGGNHNGEYSNALKLHSSIRVDLYIKGIN
jgi:hypothetical protein